MSYDKIDHADNPVAAGGPRELSDDERAAIEEERSRRLDPANRPEHAEVDNAGVTLPTVEAFAQRAQEEGPVEGSLGTSDPSAAFREIEVSEEERAAIEEERRRRLDPANRPANSEVDNTRTPRD